jgi:hypothetical protein
MGISGQLVDWKSFADAVFLLRKSNASCPDSGGSFVVELN